MPCYLITSLLVHGFVNSYFRNWRALNSEKQGLREKDKRLIDLLNIVVFFPISTNKMNEANSDIMSLAIFQW